MVILTGDLLHTPLGTMGACSERSNLLQIISPEGETMNSTEHLLQQAAKAEKLAKTINDALTVERLQAYAADCRKRAAEQAECAAA